MKNESLLWQSFLLLASLAAMSTGALAQGFSTQRAVQFEQTRDWQGMLDDATSWTQAEPNNGDAWFAMGMADYRLENGAQAIANMKHAIALNPGQTLYYNNLAAAYARFGYMYQALEALDQEEPVAEKMNDVYTWYVLGNGYAKLRDVDHAAAAYIRALALDPSYGACWTNLGTVLEMGGNSDRAMSCYQNGAANGNALGGLNAVNLQHELEVAAQQAAAYKALTSPAHMAYISYLQRVQHYAPGQN